MYTGDWEEALSIRVWDVEADVQAHLVVPGGDAVQALVLVQQVEGLTQEAAENHQSRE